MWNAVKEAIRKYADAVHLEAPAYHLYGIAKYLVDVPTRFRNIRFRSGDRGDGLPFPHPFLSFLVIGSCDLELWYRSGLRHSRLVRELLERNHFRIESFSDILDFGCGCGRVLRHWKGLPAPRVWGADINPRHIRWCREHYPFAEFRVNGLASPLDFPDGKFDLIYALSVFSHLDESFQLFWMEELARVVKPEGILILSVHGPSFRQVLTEEEMSRFESGQLIVKGTRYQGTNVCMAYHPEEYVRNTLARGFQVLDYLAGIGEGACVDEAIQDMYVMQKL